jgi:CDP-diacylglycerol---glycerol-3-phosphate 3-phosphatidyltransferase
MPQCRCQKRYTGCDPLHIDDSDSQRFDVGQDVLDKTVTGTQRFTDSAVNKVLLWLFPTSIRPNHLTVARFILTPVVLVLLYYQLKGWAFAVFAIAVCTDFIDGAMARTRDQITKAGMVMDPVADKLLIGAVLAWIGFDRDWQFVDIGVLNAAVPIILVFIVLELIFLAVGIGTARRGDRVRPANAFGKIKMVVQSIAMVLFLVAGMFDLERVLSVSLYLLWAAIFLALLSGTKHVRERFTRDKPPAATI